MRKIHRTLGAIFAPFLILSAVTGLLWAYAPYLYWKQEPQKDKTSFAVSRVVLYGKDGNIVHTADFSEPKVVLVDGDDVQLKKDMSKIPVFHRWVMRLHQLQFFGTKKELTAIPGVGLILMLITGLFLFKRGLK